MTYPKHCHVSGKETHALTFCLLSVFLPVGSTIGVAFSWVLFPTIAILLTLLNSTKFRTKGIFFFLFCLCILIINYFICIRYVEYSSKLEFNLLLALIAAFYVSVCFFSEKFNLVSLCKAIELLLAINIIFFAIQFISYYTFGFQIDYSAMTGGEGTRNFYGNIFRASGVYNEPAEYSSAMIALTSIRYLINHKLNKLLMLSLFTVALSFSFVGIFQSVAFFTAVYFKEIKRRPKLILPVIVFLMFTFYSFYDLFFQRYQDFISGTDGSNNTKLGTFNFFLDNTQYLYGGAGLIGYEPLTMPVFLQGLYDLTFFGACITIFGIFIGTGIAVLLLVFIFLKFNSGDVVIIMICLLKINVMIYASYWFFIISLIVIPGFYLKRRIL